MIQEQKIIKILSLRVTHWWVVEDLNLLITILLQYVKKHFFKIQESASELLEHFEEVHACMHGVMFSMFKYPTTRYCGTRYERFNCLSVHQFSVYIGSARLSNKSIVIFLYILMMCFKRLIWKTLLLLNKSIVYI